MDSLGQIATVEILAAHLGKSERWVRDNLAAAGCPCRRAGHDYLFSVPLVLRWIEEGSSDATPDAEG